MMEFLPFIMVAIILHLQSYTNFYLECNHLQKERKYYKMESLICQIDYFFLFKIHEIVQLKKWLI